MKLAKIKPLLPAAALVGLVGGVGLYLWNQRRAAPAPTRAVPKPALQPDPKNCKVDPVRGIKVCEMEPLDGVDVLIDPGHSTVEEGVTFGQIRESVQARKMADTLGSEIKKLMPGVRIQLTHNGGGMVEGRDASAEVAARATLTHRLRPRVFISLHYNGANMAAMVIYPNDSRPRSVQLAKAISSAIGGIRIGTSRQMSQHSSLAVLDGHNQPVAVLWEIDAINRAQDTAAYRLQRATPVARAIVNLLRA